MRDYIVTELQDGMRGLLAAALYEDRKLAMLRVGTFGSRSDVGTVVKGRVENTAKNIGGAFVCTDGRTGNVFLPTGASDPFGRVNASSPVLVQVVRDAAGIKRPVVTRNISLAGRYAVVSRRPGRISFSSKLTEEQRALIRKWIPREDTEEFHVLIRTNAAWTDKQTLLAELERLKSSMRRILDAAGGASVGTVLYRPEPFYIEAARDLYEAPDRMFSDIPACAEELTRLRASMGGRGENPVLFEHAAGALSLPALYGLPRDLERLAQPRVWLPCGGFLVIERTEAFISIDVNTGHCVKGKIPEETYRRVNLEAAAEIARQLSLRNLSGMILVDFISMRAADHNEELVNVMKKLVRKDHIHTEVVDLTPLGIMEILRQKVRRPLAEELAAFSGNASGSGEAEES